MDENYLLAAIRYVELNPVRAKLVKEPWAYHWSSAQSHITGVDDRLVKVSPEIQNFKLRSVAGSNPATATKF
jgi:putative transposase